MKVIERTMAFETLTNQELTFNLKIAIQHGKDIQRHAEDRKFKAYIFSLAGPL